MMIKIKFSIVSLFLLLAFPMVMNAQMELPRPSPNAMVKQTIGLTEVTVTYFSPGVKNRVIWGDLVPYQELWRTGANSATRINFSRDVKIEGQPLKAGEYSLFTIPSADSWVVIFNTNKNASTSDYKQEEDALRVTIRPQASPFRERMTFLFSDFTDDRGTLALEWEKIRIPINIEVSTKDQTMASIDKVLNPSWRDYANAANYVAETNKDFTKANMWIDQSIKLQNHWYNNWLKAEILVMQGNYKDAYKHATIAKELGEKEGEGFFFREDVDQALIDWKKKM